MSALDFKELGSLKAEYRSSPSELRSLAALKMRIAA